MKSTTLSYKTPKVHSERWPVAVFAHNEGKRILACLDSIYKAASGHPIEILVLANGCTDRTEDIVESYSSEHPEVDLISIELADKSNAWDVFVHDNALDRDVHFFVDGDVQACPNSLVLLHDCLANDPYAHAASALPVAAAASANGVRGFSRTTGYLAASTLCVERSCVASARRASGCR